jgi:hypothetical protein
MSDPFSTDTFTDAPRPEVPGQCQQLPEWLQLRLIRRDEHITWVRGPRHNPQWERYVTHPALFLAALAVGAACVGLGRLGAGTWAAMPVLPALAGGLIAVGSVFVLAFSNAYFTRLVVTDSRLLILQGYEVCRSWAINDLPRSLIRYTMPAGGTESRTVDLDALRTMLGGSSDQFTDAKTILDLGKRLDGIKGKEGGRP